MKLSNEVATLVTESASSGKNDAPTWVMRVNASMNGAIAGSRRSNMATMLLMMSWMRPCISGVISCRDAPVNIRLNDEAMDVVMRWIVGPNVCVRSRTIPDTFTNSASWVALRRSPSGPSTSALICNAACCAAGVIWYSASANFLGSPISLSAWLNPLKPTLRLRNAEPAAARLAGSIAADWLAVTKASPTVPRMPTKGSNTVGDTVPKGVRAPTFLDSHCPGLIPFLPKRLCASALIWASSCLWRWRPNSSLAVLAALPCAL